jgi:hypothetical protein
MEELNKVTQQLPTAKASEKIPTLIISMSDVKKSLHNDIKILKLNICNFCDYGKYDHNTNKYYCLFPIKKMRKCSEVTSDIIRFTVYSCKEFKD